MSHKSNALSKVLKQELTRKEEVEQVKEIHNVSISHAGVARVLDRHFPEIKRKQYKKKETNKHSEIMSQER